MKEQVMWALQYGAHASITTVVLRKDKDQRDEWKFSPVAGTDDQYTITAVGRAKKAVLTASKDCGCGKRDCMALGDDDGSDEQKWTITPVEGREDDGQVTITSGRSGCDNNVFDAYRGS